jgi:dTDP-4-dehydrorhamnose 3,5-epimerase
MQIVETALSGVVVLEPAIYRDARGFFMETYHAAKWAELGIAVPFVQDNHSYSVRGTLRGLHYQRERPQAKLCRVVQGEIWDVCVDIRRGSPTFGQWFGTTLSAENRRQMFVPAGFAHGFQVLSDSAELLYKCSEFYDPMDERGIAWNDPDIGIDWHDIAPLILSDKDLRYSPLRAVLAEDLPVGQTNRG